jgi:hypothetical protein
MEIPNKSTKLSKRKIVCGRKINNKIRKHIRITDQNSQYMDNEGDSWFNNGDDDINQLDPYYHNVKVVEDVSMYLLDGDFSEEEQTDENFLDLSYNMHPKKDFNKVKNFKNQLKIK